MIKPAGSKKCILFIEVLFVRVKSFLRLINTANKQEDEFLTSFEVPVSETHSNYN